MHAGFVAGIDHTWARLHRVRSTAQLQDSWWHPFLKVDASLLQSVDHENRLAALLSAPPTHTRSTPSLHPNLVPTHRTSLIPRACSACSIYGTHSARASGRSTGRLTSRSNSRRACERPCSAPTIANLAAIPEHRPSVSTTRLPPRKEPRTVLRVDRLASRRQSTSSSTTGTPATSSVCLQCRVGSQCIPFGIPRQP